MAPIWHNNFIYILINRRLLLVLCFLLHIHLELTQKKTKAEWQSLSKCEALPGFSLSQLKDSAGGPRKELAHLHARMQKHWKLTWIHLLQADCFSAKLAWLLVFVLCCSCSTCPQGLCLPMERTRGKGILGSESWWGKSDSLPLQYSALPLHLPSLLLMVN